MESSRPHLFGLLAGLFLAAGIAFAALVVAGAWSKIAESQVINVTGSARKNVRSDLVVWRASFSTEATKDALVRAEQIAGQGGRRIKELRQARMGVVQINPIFGTATSWEGNNDTTSLEKTITSTVSATFSLK